MVKMTKTRDFVNYGLKYISGHTLDLGAGTAKYKNIIIQKAESYVAMDIVAGPAIDVVGDIHKTPFNKEEFDTIISTQTLEHTRKPWVVAEEIYRILKPGGFAIIAAPFMVGYHPDPEDNFRFTKDGLSLLFSDAGFEIVEKGFYENTAVVFSEILHFNFIHPYVKHSRFAKRFMVLVEKMFFRIDRFCRSKAIFASAYMIAKKPFK